MKSLQEDIWNRPLNHVIWSQNDWDINDQSLVMEFEYISPILTPFYIIQMSILSIFSQIFQINGLNGVIVIELTTNLPQSV